MADIYKNGELIKHQNNACIPNIDWKIQAGIDPKTNLPKKFDLRLCKSKNSIKTLLRIQDEQDAVNRYNWYNLPQGLTGQELERMLYYKGQLAFFYLEPVDKFYFMPYALDGGLDFYGRYLTIHPIPFCEGTTDGEKNIIAKQRDYLSTLKLNVLYDIVVDELEYKDLTDSAVILRDYTNQLGQTSLPRQSLQEELLDIEADCIPYMHTALKNSTGIQGIRTNSPDENSNVYAANDTLDRAALNGEKWVPITGGMDFQDLTGGEVAKAEEFLLAMQSLDNFRLGTYGIDNGGLFEKKAYQNVGETAMNAGLVKSPLQDGLSQRQHFCDVVNSVWGLGVWCDISESTLSIDQDMDGVAADNDPETVSYGSDEGSSEQGGTEE